MLIVGSTVRDHNPHLSNARARMRTRKHVSAQGVQCPSRVRVALGLTDVPNGVDDVILGDVISEMELSSDLSAEGENADMCVLRRDVQNADHIFQEAELSLEVVLPDTAGGVQGEHHVCRRPVTTWGTETLYSY